MLTITLCGSFSVLRYVIHASSYPEVTADSLQKYSRWTVKLTTQNSSLQICWNALWYLVTLFIQMHRLDGRRIVRWFCQWQIAKKKKKKKKKKKLEGKKKKEKIKKKKKKKKKTKNWKEAAMAYFKFYYPGICLEGTKLIPHWFSILGIIISI